MRRFIRRIFGVQCPACGGAGRIGMYSPTARLNTIRPWVHLPCKWCDRSGRVPEARVAEYQEQVRLDDIRWRESLDKLPVDVAMWLRVIDRPLSQPHA